MNQTKIAETLGVSQPTVSNWLKGKNKPQKLLLNRIESEFPGLYTKIMSVDSNNFSGITQEYLLKIFEYHQDGTLTWKIVPPKGTVDNKVGYLSGQYLTVNLARKQLKVHKVVWFMHHGYETENILDHINRNKLDNRIENLREVTRSCNSFNVEKDSMSGVTGVTWDKKDKKWTVSGGETTKEFLDFDYAVHYRFTLELLSEKLNCMRSPAYNHLNRLKNQYESTYKINYTVEDLKVFDYGR